MANSSVSRYLTLIIVAGVVALTIAFAGSIFETVKAGEIHVKQAAVTGELTCHMQPGMYTQLFGDVFKYPISETYWIGRGNASRGDRIHVRFNDGAKAEVHGSVQIVLPTVCDKLKKIHNTFRGFDNVMQRLVKQAVIDSLYNTGPFMSSAESYAERRSEFTSLAAEQLSHGVYLTDFKEEDYQDPITGETKKRSVVLRRLDKEGNPLTKKPVFMEYGIEVENFVIQQIQYPDSVLKQIERQQEARMAVQTAVAEAKKAQQESLTILEQGKAKVAKAKAEEEEKKIRAIVKAQEKKEVAELQAQQQLKVAELDKRTAQNEMEAAILRAKGEEEAARRRIQADGALEIKLRTLKDINQLWADAYAKQRPTPDIVMGSDSKNGGVSAQDFMNLITAKTAKDLRTSLNVSNKVVR